MRYLTPLRTSGLLVSILASLTWIGCDGSGGGSGGGGGGPTAPTPFVVLTPDSGSPPSITMQQGSGTSGADLQLEIVATELENVKTLDFVLAYPGQLMGLVDVQVGSFLGTTPSLQAVALSGDRLQISLTRLEVGAANGSGVVAVIDFEGLAVGNGRLDFIDPTAESPDGLALGNIVWLGAGIQVSP